MAGLAIGIHTSKIRYLRYAKSLVRGFWHNDLPPSLVVWSSVEYALDYSHEHSSP